MTIPVSNMKSFQALAMEAMDGDTDAALLLAKRAPGKTCEFEAWFLRWVPFEDRTDYAVFDIFSDAWDRMLMWREAAKN